MDSTTTSQLRTVTRYNEVGRVSLLPQHLLEDWHGELTVIKLFRSNVEISFWKEMLIF